MITVPVELGARRYEIDIGRDLLGDPQAWLPWLAGEQVCIVSNPVVAEHYLPQVREALRGKILVEHLLPDGEQAKTLDSVAAIADTLLAAPCDANVTIVALGGGVVGDIAGFAAACYQRGVALIQAPTTLLAQVDSAVGGKTGVNHPLGKNMLGAFHQPRRVIADIGTLDTLPEREFRSALSEIVKYGVIADAELFGWLERNLDDLLARRPEALEHAVAASCRNKAAFVIDDERDRGRRALLNLGHTFGHALEAATGYGRWLHGEAVALGTVMAAELAARGGRLPKADAGRITALLDRCGLPVAPVAEPTTERMRRHMRVDKKVRDGQLRLILPAAIGHAELTTDYRTEDLDAVLDQFCTGATA